MPAACSRRTALRTSSPLSPGWPTGRTARARRRTACCSPSSCAAALQQEAVLHEGVDGQQLQRRDAELFQVVDEARVAERGEGAALVRAYVLAAYAGAAHVGLVDHRAGPGHPGPHVAGPVEAVLGHDGARHGRRAVAAVEAQVGARGVEPVAEQRVAPAQRPRQRARVRVQQQLVRVEALAALGLIGPVGAVAVVQARPGVGQVAVPDLVGAFGQRQARDFLAAGRRTGTARCAWRWRKTPRN
jgi:hypothetical protein